jgi:hypothetical protein
MLDNLTTEIRSFYSLQDLRESVEERINQYKTLVDEYSQWLGSLLRDLESTHKNDAWFKEVSALEKYAKKGVSRKEGEKKSGKEKAPTTWVTVKGVFLNATDQGEVEVLFDAIESLNKKVEQLSKVKEAVDDLERLALGKETIYVAFIRDGVPEKIVLRPRKGTGASEKFTYAADFSMIKEQ